MNKKEHTETLTTYIKYLGGSDAIQAKRLAALSDYRRLAEEFAKSCQRYTVSVALGLGTSYVTTLTG